ncbi:TerC family protein [Reichenbachiella carrageenanivorans]|uniref:TerC family protein n=1 Tax=Reichenbachiella carrageenanivorans TaxID=2979869 RepID=A0ABY6D1G1_9BACT|nr:TerC family protein [Reichenbachiella carrageenanivorans]UXX80009.1 TerC family protein [Reichenbachiella carrageenanivorans]
MDTLLTAESLIALLTLTFLEIVLGVDNIIFISIVSNKLPQEQQAKARNIGLLCALVFRIGLLFGITWIISFSEPLFTILGHAFSGRDLILAGGGLFLIAKSTVEINHKMEVMEHKEAAGKVTATIGGVIAQIIMLDIIFSFDSILTAVGLTSQLTIMIIAVVIAMFIMMTFAGKISAFIAKNPSLEVLALSFLILIGFMLTVEAMGHHVPKGYIYFAVFFSLIVEMLNIRIRKGRQKIKLNKRIEN